MDENDTINLELEFKRYLQLLRPYLGQLLDEDVIKICDTWIQRLSHCKDNEKPLRNKYLFLLCYQLAKGILEGPFLDCPPEELLPLPEDFNSDDSSYDLDCVATDSEEMKTQVLFNSKNITVSETEYLSHDDGKNCESVFDSEKASRKDHKLLGHKNVICYTCPNEMRNFYTMPGEGYESRAHNVVKKLREIKKQNTLLQKELVALKEESMTKPEEFAEEENIVKVDNATSAFIRSNESTSTMKSLKSKLQEVQESRNVLIERISNLQDMLDSFHETKKNEIEDIKANHKLEVIQIRHATREETKDFYEKKLEELQKSYETKIKELQNINLTELKDLTLAREEIINEKNNLLSAKDTEIATLKNEVEEHKKNLHSILNKFFDKPNDDSENIKFRAQQMEKRMNKMEKSKLKYAKQCEVKVTQLQREKHLAECSLQLQLVRQRAQVVSELTDENQTELNTSLEKLENKYKEIIANVQATAIQKRMQDQIALESILQAACGNDFQCQFSARNVRNPNARLATTVPPDQSYETEISSLIRGNKVGNVMVGNKSFGDDSFVAGYCLNGERMGELFERVYIPQRDNGEAK